VRKKFLYQFENVPAGIMFNEISTDGFPK